MNKPKLIKIMFILITVFIVTACNLPLNLGKNANTNTDNTSQVTEAPAQDVFTKKVDSKPVGLQEGLGSLDSYKVVLFLHSSDSKGALTETTETIERSVLDKNSHTTTFSRSFDPENDSEENNSTDETYVIGNVSCSGSGEDWTYTEMTAQEKEMLDIYKGMVDVLPLIDNPEFVSEETMNGIEANHFKFQVSGIGDSSGSVATVNSGEYWLAKDGNYIIKYHLILEVQSAAEGSQESETSNIEVSIDLTNINVPITFTLPQYCVPGNE